MRIMVRFIPYLLLVLFLGACGGGQLGVKRAPYTPPGSLASDELLVYVFRQGKMTGGARKVGIILNDTYKAVLLNDTFSYFTVKSGSNVVVSRMAPMLTTFPLDDRRAGETVYLFTWASMSGMRIKEIDEQKGQELIKKYKYTEIAVKDRKAAMDYSE